MVLAVFRFDAFPTISNVVSDVLVVEERDVVLVFFGVSLRGSILRATLDEVTFLFFGLAVGVAFLTEFFTLLRDDAFPGTIVRDARLEVLLPTVDRDVWTEEVRGLELLAAISTVRFTGRERVVLLRFERLEVDWDRTGFGAVGAVDLLDREFEGCDDALGAVAAGRVGAGAGRPRIPGLEPPFFAPHHPVRRLQACRGGWLVAAGRPGESTRVVLAATRSNDRAHRPRRRATRAR